MTKKSEPNIQYLTDKARWQAVKERDVAADGVFYYAVKTTGIYCRPSCPSRQPNYVNVEFFTDIDIAISAGNRACKRCRPEQLNTVHPHQAKVVDACHFIETAIEAPTLDQLAKRANMSTFHFQRVFKSIAGLTPKQYEKAHRERRLREELNSSKTVTETIFEAGYGSSGRFYADSSKLIGMSPTKRRAKGCGETIHFAIGECSLGAIIVAATDKGVCSIALGDDPNELIQALQSDFSKATLLAGDKNFETLVANVVGLVEDPPQNINLPLDIRGTVFQKKVWRAISAIPTGKTVNYTDIARTIGNPKSARAVAQACGANRFAVAIPCHRVIRSDGSLAGYRWGVERKRTLLDLEQANGKSNFT